jgi:hypothetical protein
LLQVQHIRVLRGNVEHHQVHRILQEQPLNDSLLLGTRVLINYSCSSSPIIL